MRPLDIARRRRSAWLRVLDAVAEMRAALDHRIWRADIDDIHLEGDCRAWCELAQSLADFLQSRRPTT